MSPTRILISALLLLYSATSLAENHSTQQLLMIHSYHAGMTWINDIEREVRDELKPQQRGIELFSEYMDTKRIPFSREYQQQLLTFLKQKYGGKQFAALLVSDNNAFNFIREHGESLFPGVPIVFCGVNFFKDEQLEGHSNITGVIEDFDTRSTLETALRLHPETRYVYIINDHLPSGKLVAEESRIELKGLGDAIKVEYSESLSIAALEQRLNDLPENSLVLLGAFFRDGEGEFYPTEESTSRFTLASKAPIYGAMDFNLGHGIVGGMLTNGTSQGKIAGKLINEILAGKPISEIAVVKEGTNRLMFDRVQLDRLGIDPESLPVGSIQINQNQVTLSSEEQSWLREHPVIRLAPDPDYPPVEFFDRNGEYHGLAADYIRLLEHKVGIRFNIEQHKNWDEVVAKAQSRDVDMWGAASATEQRRKYMLFTQPMINVPAVIMTRHDGADQLTMNDLETLRVTVVSGYAVHEHILANYPEIQLDVAPDIRTALRKVSFGEVDVMVGNLATSTYYMGQEGIGNLKVVGDSGYRYKLALAIRSDWPELREILDKGLRMISKDERNAIMDKWIRLDMGQRSWWQLTREQVIVLVIVLSLLILAVVLAWNMILRQRVRERTARLAATNDKLQESEEKYRTIFELSEEPMWIIEGDRFKMTNEAAARMLGYDSIDELEDTPPWQLSPGIQPDGSSSMKKAKEMIDRAMEYGYNRFEWTHQKKSGTTFPVEVSLTRIPYEGGAALFCVWNDITERKRAEEEIRRLATHDTLTGLINLRLAQDRIEHTIAESKRNRNKAAVLFIDLDGFKIVNDSHGHDAGDYVLIEVAKRLTNAVREIDSIARIGGDEFLVVLNNINGVEDAEWVAAKLIKSIKEPYLYHNQQLRVGASIGIAIYPDHGETRDQLVKAADDTMYLIKKSNKGNYLTTASV